MKLKTVEKIVLAVTSFVIVVVRAWFIVTSVVIVALLWSKKACAEPANAKIEAIVKAAVNDPDSVVFDSGWIVTDAQGNRVACGSIRVRNALGGIVRANYVIDPAFAELPLYIGPTPLAWVGRRLCNKPS